MFQRQERSSELECVAIVTGVGEGEGDGGDQSAATDEG